MSHNYDDNTMLYARASDTSKANQSEEQTWKKIAIGSVSGILMGGGAAFATHQYHTQGGEVVTSEESVSENRESICCRTTTNGLQIAEGSENMSFQEAFEAAREAIGAGGVFHWHGGVYNTYTLEEWATMSEAEHFAFAQKVQSEIPMSQLEVDHQESIHTAVVIVPEKSINSNYGETPIIIDHTQDDSALHEELIIAQGEYETTEMNGQIVAVRPLAYDGHMGAEIDLDIDGLADLVVVDVNDNGVPEQDEIVLLNDDIVPSYYDDSDMEENVLQPDEMEMNDYIDLNDIALDLLDFYNDIDISGIV